MPKKKGSKCAKGIKTRTIKPTPDTYMHCAVVRKKGPRGGRTVCGPVKKVKKK